MPAESRALMGNNEEKAVCRLDLAQDLAADYLGKITLHREGLFEAAAAAGPELIPPEAM